MTDTAAPPDVEIVDEDPATPAQLPAVVEVVERIPDRIQPQAIVGLPDVREVQTMELVAAQISATEMVPKAYRNKPDAILACWLAGRELRIPPMQSLRDIDIVEGKPAPSAKLVRELIMRAGHSIRRVSGLDDETAAVYRYRRREWPADEWEEGRYTIEMAIKAGLVRRNDDGTLQARDSQNRPKPWEKYTAAMLRHRCLTTIGREEFPDCLGTMIYTAEELLDGDGVDEDGRLLDSPATDQRTPAQIRWDLAMEALPEAGQDYALEQFNKAAGGKPFAFISGRDQEGWATWIENLLAAHRDKLRREAAGDVDPDQPHGFKADELGACVVCGGAEQDPLHAGGDAAPAPASKDAPSSEAPPAAPGPGRVEGPQAGVPDEPPLGEEMPAPARMRRFHALKREVGWPDAAYREWIRATFQVSSSKDLGAADLERAIGLLEEVVAGASSEQPEGPPAAPAPAAPTRKPVATIDPPPALNSDRQTASEGVSAGQATEAQRREQLEERYTEAYGRVAAASEARKGRLDAKRVMTLPEGADGWTTASIEVLAELVAHAEKAANEIDPSRPLPALEAPY